MKSSPEVRAKAEAELIMGGSVSAVARAVGVDKGTVSRWRAAMPEDLLQQITTNQTEDFNRLLREFLSELMITTIEQAKFVRNREWLWNQDAKGIACLFAVINDVMLVFLNAAQRTSE